MREPEAPCLFCDERHVGCHTECDKYKAYTKERKAYREHITKQKVEENQLEEIELNRFRR